MDPTRSCTACSKAGFTHCEKSAQPGQSQQSETLGQPNSDLKTLEQHMPHYGISNPVYPQGQDTLNSSEMHGKFAGIFQAEKGLVKAEEPSPMGLDFELEGHIGDLKGPLTEKASGCHDTGELINLLLGDCMNLALTGICIKDEVYVDATKENFGEKHPNTLSSMATLALTYRELGRHDDALNLEKRMLDARKEIVGENHPNTLTVSNGESQPFLLPVRIILRVSSHSA